VISGNVKFGLVLVAAGANHDIVQDTFIGTDSTGTSPLPNNGVGLVIAGGASDNQIGGTAAGAGNLISGNVGSGIDIVGRVGGQRGSMSLNPLRGKADSGVRGSVVLQQ
jgi:hypothetical protein